MSIIAIWAAHIRCLYYISSFDWRRAESGPSAVQVLSIKQQLQCLYIPLCVDKVCSPRCKLEFTPSHCPLPSPQQLQGGILLQEQDSICFISPLLCRSTAPKVIPLPRERWCSRSFPSQRGPRRPHDPHGIISCVCVCFREWRLHCWTAAALRRKSFLSVVSEGCHYCWALNIIIRGYKLRRCQGWSARHKGVIIFVRSSLAGRHNIWIILSMRHVTPKWISNAILLCPILGVLFSKQEGGCLKTLKSSFIPCCSAKVRNTTSDFEVSQNKNCWKASSPIALHMLPASNREIFSSLSPGWGRFLHILGTGWHPHTHSTSSAPFARRLQEMKLWN